jgi:hypothetical protein
MSPIEWFLSLIYVILVYTGVTLVWTVNKLTRDVNDLCYFVSEFSKQCTVMFTYLENCINNRDNSSDEPNKINEKVE